MATALETIAPDRFRLCPHHLLNTQWLLLAAGDFAQGRWNAMTIAWGAFGTMWGLPFAQVVVRPQRYTREFLEAFDTFTLTAFPKAYRAALETMGSRSGRQGNKAAAAGLTPVAATQVAAPVFQEAELAVECRKLFAQDMTPAALLDPRAAACYPSADYHRVYYGEIVAVRGESKYAAG
jgi:flavin reductase (DIM6/NTAB) family NADH-FMN oxidoreductase RutF